MSLYKALSTAVQRRDNVFSVLDNIPTYLEVIESAKAHLQTFKNCVYYGMPVYVIWVAWRAYSRCRSRAKDQDQLKRVEDGVKRLEDGVKRLEDGVKRLEEMLKRVEKHQKALRVNVGLRVVLP